MDDETRGIIRELGRTLLAWQWFRLLSMFWSAILGLAVGAVALLALRAACYRAFGL